MFHSVGAQEFAGLPPRWADEGIAMLSESATSRQHHKSFIATTTGLFSAGDMLKLQDYVIGQA